MSRDGIPFENINLEDLRREPSVSQPYPRSFPKWGEPGRKFQYCFTTKRHQRGPPNIYFFYSNSPASWLYSKSRSRHRSEKEFWERSRDSDGIQRTRVRPTASNHNPKNESVQGIPNFYGRDTVSDPCTVNLQKTSTPFSWDRYDKDIKHKVVNMLNGRFLNNQDDTSWKKITSDDPNI